MTAQVVTYTPADPSGVLSVSRLRLYSTAARTDPPVVDVGPAVVQPDGTWAFTLPDGTPDGVYFTKTTVTYLDASTADDVDDSITLPLQTAGQLGDPIALWVSASTVKAAVTGASDADALAAAQIATDVLYALSGRRYPGPRVATMRVPPSLAGPRELLPTSLPWGPVGSLRRGCGSCVLGFDPLLHPVRSVIRMTIGEVDVPADQLDVRDQRVIRVVRGTTTDPLAVNRWCGPDGAYSLFPGSCGCASPGVEVTFVWGADVPAGGLASARLFAIELLKALGGDQSCRLPGNLVSVSRQGVSIVLDPSTFLDQGRTGIPLVDTWLASVNPAKRKGEPLVWWPESSLPEVVG